MPLRLLQQLLARASVKIAATDSVNNHPKKTEL